MHYTGAVMKCVLSRTVALAYHHGLLFTPLRYTYVTLTSSPQFTSHYLTSPPLHFTSLHLLMIPTRLSFHLIRH
jgi:hypothetical protein